MRIVFLLLFNCAVMAADTNAFLNSWLEAQAKLKSWTADFVQTRALKTLKQPLKTPGRLSFEAPNNFRWELGDPAQTIAIRTSDELRIEYPKLQKIEKYPLTGRGNEPWRDALALMDAGFPASRAELEGRFKMTSITSTNDLVEIIMEPRSSGSKRYMSEVQLSIRTNDFSMAANQLRFADGSTLRNDFTNAVKTLKK